VLHFKLRAESIGALVDFARRDRATVLHAVPSVFRLFAGSIPPGVRFPDLRLLLIGGEAMFEGDFELFKEHFEPGCVLVNHLGSTEISGYAQDFFTHQSRLPGGVLPVGRPPEGVSVSIVDEDGRAAPPGDAGTIVVESEFLAAGYWNLPALSRERFVPVPGSRARRFITGDRGRLLPDSRLVYLGRSDDQVQVRGNRVEPVEMAPADAVVTDIVYKPLVTPLLARAAARGLKTVDGLGMLLHQAAPGFERWFGRRPEVDGDLRAAVLAS
jgi:non-ribosomal peptide synthetase component F